MVLEETMLGTARCITLVFSTGACSKHQAVVSPHRYKGSVNAADKLVAREESRTAQCFKR